MQGGFQGRANIDLEPRFCSPLCGDPSAEIAADSLCREAVIGGSTSGPPQVS
jgi:hypothetical protein